MLTLKDCERATKSIADLLQIGPINTNLSAEDLAQQNLTPAKGEPLSPPPRPAAADETSPA